MVDFWLYVEKYSVKIERIIRFSKDFMYCSSSPNEQILNKRADKLWADTIKTTFILIIGCTTYFAYPLYTIIMYGARPFFVPIYLPFTNPDTTMGYYLNTCVHAMQAFTCVAGNIGLQIIFLLILNTLWTTIDVIQFELENMDRYNYGNTDIIIDRRILRNELYEIFRKINDVDRSV